MGSIPTMVWVTAAVQIPDVGNQPVLTHFYGFNDLSQIWCLRLLDVGLKRLIHYLPSEGRRYLFHIQAGLISLWEMMCLDRISSRSSVWMSLLISSITSTVNARLCGARLIGHTDERSNALWYHPRCCVWIIRRDELEQKVLLVMSVTNYMVPYVALLHLMWYYIVYRNRRSGPNMENVPCTSSQTATGFVYYMDMWGNNPLN